MQGKLEIIRCIICFFMVPLMTINIIQVFILKWKIFFSNYFNFFKENDIMKPIKMLFETEIMWEMKKWQVF